MATIEIETAVVGAGQAGAGRGVALVERNHLGGSPCAPFTEPELDRVGMAEAQEAGHRVLVGRRPMVESGEAPEISRTRGFIEVVAEAGSRRILGAAALCESGSEVVQLFVELMNAGATADTMLRAAHIHPTLAEAAKDAATALREG